MTATMDFFQHQDDARRSSGRLVVLFVLAVLAIMVATYLVVAGVVVYAGSGQTGADGAPLVSLWDWRLMALIGFATVAIVAGGSAFKAWQLRGGGPAVAEMLGGRLLEPATEDHAGRVMLNVVEEMAIASGTPVPPVYVLEKEGGINAFAAGRTSDDAVIGITRGALDRLDRDELQGVVAHEFSHIFNGDMALNIKLMGLLHGILVIGLLGYTVLRSMRFARYSSRRGKNGGGAIAAVLAIGVGLLVVGFAGVFFGNMIKAAVSRQREFLADASAVQFTRNPDGIASALKVIGGHAYGGAVENKHAAEASHMYFASGVKPFLASAFATHPPLPERIRRIDPAWDGAFPERPPLDDLSDLGRYLDSDERKEHFEERRLKAEAARASAEMATAGFAATAASMADRSDAHTEQPLRPVAGEGVVRAALAMVGSPSQAHLDHARSLLEAIPQAVREAAHEPFSARAVIHALLLDHDPSVRRGQLRHLAVHAEPGVAEETERLAPLLDALPSRLRLPLVDLVLPALRRLSERQYAGFRDDVTALVSADDHIDLSEWVLQRLFLKHLAPTFEGARPARTLYYALHPRLAPHLEVLLSTLARAGHGDEESASAAFALAAGNLGDLGDLELTLRPPRSMRYSELDFALDTLAEVAPPVKKQVLAACALSVAADHAVTEREAELFRAVADSLGVPIPPLLPGQALA